jgi:hypothetical protein
MTWEWAQLEGIHSAPGVRRRALVLQAKSSLDSTVTTTSLYVLIEFVLYFITNYFYFHKEQMEYEIFE